jgi:hypothetical protein
VTVLFLKGDRVTLSASGRRIATLTPVGREGTVVSTKNEVRVSILWDGRVSPESWAKVHVVKVSE